MKRTILTLTATLTLTACASGPIAMIEATHALGWAGVAVSGVSLAADYERDKALGERLDALEVRHAPGECPPALVPVSTEAKL